MKLVYVAGPFRAPTPWGVEQNVRRAEEWGLRVAKVPALVPVIPHSMFRYYDGQGHDDYWLAATLAIMERCDALLLVPGWESSAGSRAERERAIEAGLIVFDAEHEYEALSRYAAWTEPEEFIRQERQEK